MTTTRLRAAEAKRNEVLMMLRQAPFSSAGDLGGWRVHSTTECHRILGELKDRGLADSASLGMSRRVQVRWWVTDRGDRQCTRVSREYTPWPSTPYGLLRVKSRLPAAEQIYHHIPKAVAQRFATGNVTRHNPKVVRLEWLERAPMDAIVEWEDDTTIFFLWVGLWNTGASLRGRLSRWSRDLDHIPPRWWNSYDEEPQRFEATPSAWCVVAANALAGQSALDELARLGHEDRTLVFAAGSKVSVSARIGKAIGHAEKLPGRPRRHGDYSRTARLIKGAETQQLNGRFRVQLLGHIEMCPGITLDLLKAFVRNNVPDGCTVEDEVDKCVAADLVLRFGEHLYPSEKYLNHASERDRVEHDRAMDRFGQFINENSQPRDHMVEHDTNLLRIVSRLFRNKVPVFPGWQGLINFRFSRSTQLVPDAVVFAGHNSGLGAGWYHLEYERSNDSDRAIARKLTPWQILNEMGYRVGLLVVCDTAKAERAFWRQGTGSPDLPMLTSTLQRALREPLVGANTAWRYYGKRAPLFAPAEGKLVLTPRGYWP